MIGKTLDRDREFNRFEVQHCRIFVTSLLREKIKKFKYKTHTWNACV